MTPDEALNVDTTTLIEALELKSSTISTAVAYIDAVRGAAHFRECVKELLKGTPYDEPIGYDAEGLYGRLRNAVNDALKVQSAGVPLVAPQKETP